MTLFKLAATVSAFALAGPATTLAGTVFIPEGSANTVLVVKAETGAILDRLTGLEAIHGLAGAPDAKYLVAGSFTEIERDEVPAAEKPEGVSEDDHAAHHAKPGKAAMPADIGLSLVTILDATTREAVRRIEVPGAVHHTAISRDGRLAVATHPAGDGISIIDLETLRFRAFIPTGPIPNYAVFTPDGGKVYVTNSGNGTLSEVDTENGYVTRNIRVGEGPEHLVMTENGAVAFVADSDGGNVYRVDLANGTVTDSYDIGGELHGISLSDHGSILFVAGKGTDRLVAIDLATGKQRETVLSPKPYHLTTLPGTGKLMVSSRSEPKVWIVDQATLISSNEIAIQGEGHQMVALP
jgi:YVTN family beta-propeller protein